jgi:hypothetical protein
MEAGGGIVKLPSKSTAYTVRVEEWLRRTQAQSGMSFSAWADKAGVADTSVTRFLKHGQPIPHADAEIMGVAVQVQRDLA